MGIASITLLYAGLMALLNVFLALDVVGRRRKKLRSYHHNCDEELSRHIRAHGNFAENAPFILLLILLLEVNQIHYAVLHLLGITLVVSRLFHAYGLLVGEDKDPKSFKGRVYGMYGTFFIYIIVGFLGIAYSIMGFLLK